MAEGTVTPVPLTDTGHYFTLAEFRSSDPAFASSTEFPDVDVDAARAWAEERFEHAADCAWVERTAIETHVGPGSLLLELAHMDIRVVSAVSIDGTALTADELAALVVFPYGMVKRSAGWTRDSVIVVTYTYGKTSIPAPVKEAVILLTQFKIVPKNLRQNALSESTDVGFIRIAHATPGGKTGLLEVDAVAADYGHTRVHVG